MIMACQPPALMEFREDWNRSDSTSLGSNWRNDANTMKIASNRVQFKTPSSGNGRAGAWSTYIGSYNGGRLLTDNWAIEGQLIAPSGSEASDNSTCVGAAMMDTIGSGMVLVYFVTSTGNGAAIFTYTGSSIVNPYAATGQTNQTQRTTSVSSVADTALIRLERKMYSATQSIFTPYVNGSVYGTPWNDSDGVVPAGDRTKRRWFIQNEGNFPIFQSAFYSPAFDSNRALDLRS